MTTRARLLSLLGVGFVLAILWAPVGQAQSWVGIHVYPGWVGQYYAYGVTPYRVDSTGCSSTSNWIWFQGIPASSIGSMAIDSRNVANRSHIVAHNGLDGAYFCIYGTCTVKLCGKDGGVYNGWSYILAFN